MSCFFNESWTLNHVRVVCVCPFLSAPCGLRPPPASWSLPSGGWCFLCWLSVCLSALWSPGWFSFSLLPFSPWSSAPARWLQTQDAQNTSAQWQWFKLMWQKTHSRLVFWCFGVYCVYTYTLSHACMLPGWVVLMWSAAAASWLWGPGRSED